MAASKYDLVGYITGIQSMITFQTTQTGDTPSGILTREHDRAYKELWELLQKEEKENKEKKHE